LALTRTPDPNRSTRGVFTAITVGANRSRTERWYDKHIIFTAPLVLLYSINLQQHYYNKNKGK